MFHFTRAILRRPSRYMTQGLTNATLGIPDYSKALQQHDAYCAALEYCGLQVDSLDASDAYPDSVFVEDVAILTPACVILTCPPEPTRAGEVEIMRPVLEANFPRVERIRAPGALDGGDVMQVGSHFYVGLSDRTNNEGAQQLKSILENDGMTASVVPVEGVLHLKTGVTAWSEDRLLALDTFAEQKAFSQFDIIRVDGQEAPAANCLRINDHVLLPAGNPKTAEQLVKAGANVLEVDISEYAKLDGGLTCLSLRY